VGVVEGHDPRRRLAVRCQVGVEVAPADVPDAVSVPAPVGGAVPATLSLTLGPPANFGAFTPGITNQYSASTPANVVSTALDATLTVAGPDHLMNGSFALPEPLQVSLSKSAWTAPVSNDPLTIGFKQLVKASDALRTGAYGTTLTFTLSTTNP
jgi:amidase